MSQLEELCQHANIRQVTVAKWKIRQRRYHQASANIIRSEIDAGDG